MLDFIRNEQVYSNQGFNVFKKQITNKIKSGNINEELLFIMYKDKFTVEEAVTEILLTYDL